LWTDLYESSSYLGKIDDSRIGPDSRGNTLVTLMFLEMADQKYFRQSDVSKTTYPKTLTVIDREDLNETCILSTYQLGLPLFVFDSIYETQAEYDRLARQGESADEASATLAQFHTAKRFFYINEPLGKVTHIPAAELEDTMNLMLHLGVFEVDENYNYIHCLRRKPDSKALIMEKWLQNELDDSTGVYMGHFVTNVTRYNELMVKMLEKTNDILGSMAAPPAQFTEAEKKEAIAAFEGYVMGAVYPIIPETLLQNRLLKNVKIKNMFKNPLIKKGYNKKIVTYRRDNPEPVLYKSLPTMLQDMNFERPDILSKVISTTISVKSKTKTIPPKNESTNLNEEGGVQPEMTEPAETLKKDQGLNANLDVEAELERLLQWKEKGLLTEEIYNEEVRELMKVRG